MLFHLSQQYCVDSGLPPWCCIQFETTRIPHLLQRWVSCLYNKVSTHCLKRSSQSGVRQCVRMYLRASESRKLVCDSLWVCALKFPLMRARVVYMHVSFSVFVYGPSDRSAVTSLSESLFTSQWPVWGSSSKCHPPPALSMFLKICTTVTVALEIRDFPTHFLIILIKLIVQSN